ncbi:uncharacterized protein LOC118437464 [Folsomia candida]|nr:uncharacterized protein LOC118437464 [Folsomia candida]
MMRTNCVVDRLNELFGPLILVACVRFLPSSLTWGCRLFLGDFSVECILKIYLSLHFLMSGANFKMSEEILNNLHNRIHEKPTRSQNSKRTNDRIPTNKWDWLKLDLKSLKPVAMDVFGIFQLDTDFTSTLATITTVLLFLILGQVFAQNFVLVGS